jgi:hypothetical protein
VRGRKPIAERDEVRGMRVTLRLTEEEYHYLQALALKRGRPLGEVVRALSLVEMPVSK